MTRAAEEVLTVDTARCDMRAEIVGWNHENPALVQPGHIRMTGSPTSYAGYPTVMHALADGWRLLGPPMREDEDGWTWWLVRTLAGGAS